jgi:hypothetical protein
VEFSARSDGEILFRPVQIVSRIEDEPGAVRQQPPQFARHLTTADGVARGPRVRQVLLVVGLFVLKIGQPRPLIGGARCHHRGLAQKWQEIAKITRDPDCRRIHPADHGGIQIDVDDPGVLGEPHAVVLGHLRHPNTSTASAS